MLNLSLDSQETFSLPPFSFPLSPPPIQKKVLSSYFPSPCLPTPLFYQLLLRTNGRTDRQAAAEAAKGEEKRKEDPLCIIGKRRRGRGGEVFFPPRPSLYWKLTGLTDGVTKAEKRRDGRGKKVDMKQPPSRHDHHVELVQRTKCRTRRKLKFIKTSLPFPSSYEISRNYSTPLTIFGDEVRTGDRKKLLRAVWRTGRVADLSLSGPRRANIHQCRTGNCIKFQVPIQIALYEKKYECTEKSLAILRAVKL